MINARLNEPLGIKQIKTKYLGAVWQFARLVWTANPRVTQLAPPSGMANSVEFPHPVAMTALVVLWLEKNRFLNIVNLRHDIVKVL